MKSKILISLNLCLVLITSTFAQYVPNGGFENWENRVLYEEPVSWNTGNMEAFTYNAATAYDTSDSYCGELALRLETVILDEDTLFGYAFCEGMISEGGITDTFYYTGGIPISGTPDSIMGYFKYHIAENDTGIVLASFKREGAIICQNIFMLTGNQSVYTKLKWNIDDMIEVPDTAMIAFACTNPNNPKEGGWLQVDSVCFTGIDDTIPNADFENWEEASYQEPVSWVTANLFSFLFGGDTCATPTSDAHSGNLAIRIESVEAWLPFAVKALSDLSKQANSLIAAPPVCGNGICEAGEDFEGCPSDCSPLSSTVVGFAMPYSGSYSLNEDMPTFDVDFNPSALTGYYKFDPMVDDTALVYVYLTDSEENTYNSPMILLPISIYFPFIVPIMLPEGVTITKMGIVASTSIHFMEADGQSGEIGSVLYLDDLELINPCEENTFAIASVQYPLCDDNTAVIDAGSGWAEYLWSTGAETQSITVPITAETTYSVTVTAEGSGCQYSDEVTISLPICNAINPTSEKKMGADLYPNPSAGVFILEFINALPGKYNAEIIAVTGKVLFKDVLLIDQASKKVQFDLTKYPEGLYLIKISGAKFSYCERIMIQ